MDKDNGMHKVNATDAQANFLNEYAEAHRRYRNALENLQQSVERELQHHGRGLGHQDLSEVQHYWGRISALDNTVWHVFHDLPETGKERRERVEEVQGWLEIGRTKNDNAMMSQNWFIAAKD